MKDFNDLVNRCEQAKNILWEGLGFRTFISIRQPDASGRVDSFHFRAEMDSTKEVGSDPGDFHAWIDEDSTRKRYHKTPEEAAGHLITTYLNWTYQGSPTPERIM
ncbi:MAG: hypothetical protein V7629_08090 [Motiliproteus sp.]